MADFLFTFAVEEALKKIVNYGAEQIGVAWNLEKEASQLTKELQYAVAILADIDKRKLHQDFVKLWVKDLQEIVFEADDLLDKLRYEDLRQTVEQTVEQTKFEKVRDYVSPSNNSFLSRLEMAKKMEKITETLREHYIAAIPFGITGHESSIIERENDLMTNRETFSFLDFQPLEERDAEVSKILKRVMKYSTNEHHMFVISIFGMGGLGKTTLAKMVFNHETIKGHFDKTIWVCVSKPFIVTKILEKIYEDLELPGSALKSKQALVGRLRKEMQDKKYFLVLDDVWDTEKRLWEDLSDCLKQISGNFGNCIMVTTRSSEVAKMVGSVYPHQVEKLSNDQCWELFKESANANQSSMEEMLENKKEELVKKMSGVPLVAKVLGGAVKFEGDYESWVTKVESMIARNISIDDTADYIFSTLKLSVDYLPHPMLKQCFAYCSNFPQDYDFEKDDLIQMWIAQGFIQPQQERENLTMEDIGEQYFNILLSRSLFQDVKLDENNRIVGFKMHDLMHDIAFAISNHPQMESNPNNLSRESAKMLRTLILNDEDIDYKVLDLSCLRVLKLNMRYWFNDFRIPLNKLIHLRYLDFSDTALLDCTFDLGLISVLYHLQTLKLQPIESCDLPKNLKNLVNLRHLEFYLSYFEPSHVGQMPLHMGNLIHLQTLPQFVIALEKGRKIEELGSLKNLKGRLTLFHLENVQSKEEAMAAKLGEKKNLRHLIFWWFARGENDNYDDHKQVLEGLQPHKNVQVLEIIGFHGKGLPNSIFVKNLVEICLLDCKRCEELPMLGQLRNLKKLSIEDMDSVTRIGNEFYGIDTNDHTNSFAFPKLAELHIEGMEKLEQWDEETVVIASNLFGCLKKLFIYGCNQLAKLPSGLEGCQSIEYLMIDRCPNLMLNVKYLHNLHSLEISELKRWPEGLGELTHLKELRIQRIQGIQNYDFRPRDEYFESSELPQQLQHLTNLEIFRIVSFNGIEALPEWLGNLTSLTTLEFYHCLKLKELPSRETFLRLTKLKDLFVDFRGELNEEQERAKLSDLPINLIVIPYCQDQAVDVSPMSYGVNM